MPRTSQRPRPGLFLWRLCFPSERLPPGGRAWPSQRGSAASGAGGSRCLGSALPCALRCGVPSATWGGLVLSHGGAGGRWRSELYRPLLPARSAHPAAAAAAEASGGISSQEVRRAGGQGRAGAEAAQEAAVQAGASRLPSPAARGERQEGKSARSQGAGGAGGVTPGTWRSAEGRAAGTCPRHTATRRATTRRRCQPCRAPGKPQAAPDPPLAAFLLPCSRCLFASGRFLRPAPLPSRVGRYRGLSGKLGLSWAGPGRGGEPQQRARRPWRGRFADGNLVPWASPSRR